MRGRNVAVVIGALVLLILLVTLLGGGMMMMCCGGFGFGFGPFGWIAMLLFWVLIIGGLALIAVWIFREATPAAPGPGGSSRALEILKERYARGEITREQYEEMRREIAAR